MATYYWDYGNTTTDTTTTDNVNTFQTDGSTDNTTGGNDNYQWRMSTSSTIEYHVQRYLVRAPDGWELENECAELTRLVNDETHTGFTIHMWIHGEIAITDPFVRKISMEEFRLMLKRRANNADRELINAFFEKHPAN